MSKADMALTGSGDPMRIHPETSLGSAHLRVSDLERSVHFYTGELGLRVITRRDKSAVLGTDPTVPLVTLHGQPDARPKPYGTTGLYHFALLVPSRADLGTVLQHLMATGYPLQGTGDHLVSESVYLADPDGNGIELYRDRPREEWPYVNGHLQMDTLPLDIAGVLHAGQAEPRAWLGVAPGTRMGHVHLQVANLADAEAFYREALGFDLMLRYRSSAAFLSAGGYHHPIGLNTWGVVGAPAPPANAVGLHHISIHVPNPPTLDGLAAHLRQRDAPFGRRNHAIHLQDPSHNQIRIIAAKT